MFPASHWEKIAKRYPKNIYLITKEATMKTIFSRFAVLVVLAFSAIGAYAQDDAKGEMTATPEKSCTVSTADARIVQVRVGPGENRTSVTFLPADIEVEVTGQTADDNDNLWYQVDKEVAAPGRAINEAWVLAETVITSGSCDDVTDTAAPPIIPIITRPTPAASEADSEASGDSDEPAPATDIKPNDGLWTLSWGPTITFYCPNTGSETVPTIDYFGASNMHIPTQVINITHETYLGFIFFDTPLTPTGNGAYQGDVYFVDDEGLLPSTVYVDAINTPNQMVGRIYTSDGTCSGTFTYIANHN
jgi:hypothetical protein